MLCLLFLFASHIFCENVLVISQICLCSVGLLLIIHSGAPPHDNQSSSWPFEVAGFSRLIAAVYLQAESQKLIIFLLFGLKFVQTKTSIIIQVNHEDKYSVAESMRCIPIYKNISNLTSCTSIL